MIITEKYAFFYGGYCSQWYHAPMTINMVTYSCCEQYMMFRKAMLFEDREIAEEVLKTSNPSVQKSLGRRVRNFDPVVWSQQSFNVVYEANYAKFTQNLDLKQQLLSLGNRILVEASPTDTIWGIGLDEFDPLVNNPMNWRGQNLLGWAITLVKQELQNGSI